MMAHGKRIAARTDALAEIADLARCHGFMASARDKPVDLMAAREQARRLGCSLDDVGDATARGWDDHTRDTGIAWRGK